MRINGSEFKIDTTGQNPAAETGAPPQTSDPTADEVERALQEDFFTDDSTSQDAEQARSSDPMDDYMFGMTAEAENASFMDWLDNFPPTIEEIIAGNENAINYLDVVKAKFEKGLEDISKIKIDTLQNLQSGILSASEAANANLVIGKCETSLIRLNTEIEKTNALVQRQETLFASELNEWKDLNNDGKIADLYRVVTNSHGETVYVDIESGRVVASPMFDPNYEPTLTEDGAMSITTSPRNAPARSDRTIDLFLKLNPSALSNFTGVNEFETPAYITPPMAYWVYKKGDGNGELPYMIDTDSSELKMKVYENFVEGENGVITQKIDPNVRTDLMQVKVAKVNVLSTDSGLKDNDGNILYNTELEFLDCDGVLITRLRIEGFEAPGSTQAATTLEHSSTKYVAASSVGFGIYNFRGEIDATQYVSTCKHGVEGLPEKLGVTRPSSEKGREVFDANMEVFNNSGSRYVAASENDTEKTGIFVGGRTRGIVDATRYSDIIKTCGVDDFSDAEKERMPDDSAPMTKTNGLYANFVHANAGKANIVVGGNGDNYIFDSTFAWVETNRSSDETFIAAPAIKYDGEDDRESVAFNPSTFIHVEGGKVNIDNPSETDHLAQSEALDEASAEAVDENAANPDRSAEDAEENADGIQNTHLSVVEGEEENDYYDIVGSTTASFVNSTDPDIAGGYTASTDGAMAREEIERIARERMDAWQDEMSKMPEIDEAEINTLVANAGASETELTNETNSFFDSMFGDIDSFFAEQDAGASEQ